MSTRLLVLAPELVLLLANLLAFSALLAAGPRAGRVARMALVGGCAAALAAAIITRDAADHFLFHSYRIDPLSQLAKAAICLGGLVAATSARGEDRWAEMRTTAPFFHLAAVTSLVLAAGLVDVLALPLALWLAVTATILVAATVGRWSSLEKIVRRSLAGWLAALGLSLGGAVIIAAAAGSSRLHLVSGAWLDAPRGAALAGWLMWCAAAAWMIAAAPWLLRRLPDELAASRAAPALASTSLVTAGGLVLLRALSIAAGGLPEIVAALLLLALVAPAFVSAARRFAVSFARPGAIAVAIGAMAVAGLILWPWIVLAVGELD